MPVNVPIALWVSYARINQYLDANKFAKQRIFRGKTLSKNYVQILRMVRLSVEWAFGQNPNDETLNATGTYLYSLLDVNAALAVIGGATCTPVYITANPNSQTITSGNNVTFSVLAGGTAPFTYQWQKNGSNITGATSASYTITGATAPDAGAYRCVVSNPCGIVPSLAATLTVNAAPISFVIGWSATDPFVDNSTPLTITNSQTISYSPGANIVFSGDLTNFANKYVMFSYLATEPVATGWFNTVLNQGVIPDFTFRDIFTIGATRYVCCRNPIALDITSTLSLTH